MEYEVCLFGNSTQQIHSMEEDNKEDHRSPQLSETTFQKRINFIHFVEEEEEKRKLKFKEISFFRDKERKTKF
jgi:hypothetical protein